MRQPLPRPAILPAAAVAAINHLLDQAVWAREKLHAFAGQCVRIELSTFSAPLTCLLQIADDGRLMPPAAGEDSEVAVSIALPPNALWLLLQGQEALLRAVRISGSAEFAETLGYVIRHLRWDAEEDLARAMGDIAAHRLVGGVSALAAWQRDKLRSVAENIGEYLTEERPLIVRRLASADFSVAVAALQRDVERLEQRLQQLAR